jgi:hypothetical protein
MAARCDDDNADWIGTNLAGSTSYVGNVGDNCLACGVLTTAITFCASQGHNCRGAQLCDPTATTQPPSPSTDSGILWRQCGVPLARITDGTANTFLTSEQIARCTNRNALVEANQCVGSTAPPLNYLAQGAKITNNGSVDRNGDNALGQ